MWIYIEDWGWYIQKFFEFNYHGFKDSFESSESKIKANRDLFDNGFDDTEVANLDKTLLKFLKPRLKRFIKINDAHPPSLTAKKWNKILKRGLKAVKILSEYKYDYNTKKINKSLKDFNILMQYVNYLWI